MTGRIQRLSTLRSSGVIRGADDRSVDYEAAAVLAPGSGALAIGELVEFDLLEGRWPKAVNVRPRLDLPPRRTYLQYQGFEQNGSVRAYRFRKVTPLQPDREFTVNADMALFSKHHVAFQDGPALSARRLLSSDASAGLEPQWLSEDDLTRYGATRSPDGAGHKRRRPAG